MNGSIARDRHSNAVSISSVDTTSIMVPNLVAGAEYIFNITAENNVGSSTIMCGPILHVIGKTKIKTIPCTQSFRVTVGSY